MVLTLKEEILDRQTEMKDEMDKKYIIRILQKYKTAKSKLLKKRIHLVWQDGEIDWIEAEKSFYKTDPNIEREIKREFLKMTKQINFDESQIESVNEQYHAGLLCNLVEFWLSELSSRESEVLFRSYIDHDYEKKYGYYMGLSETEIAEKLAVNATTVMRIKKRAIKKILSINDS